MYNQHAVTLLTYDRRIEFFVRGDRFATYRYTEGAMPGFTALYTYGDRSLTQPAENGVALWIEHDNILRKPTPFDATRPAPSRPDLFTPPYTLDMTIRRGSSSVGFQQVCQWQDNNGGDTLVETRTIRVTPGPSEGAILDMTFELRAPAREGIVLGKTERALLCLRAAPTLFSTGPFMFGGGQLRNSLGTYGASDVHGRQADWCACIGVVNGETVGFALLEHPSNPFFPSPWRAQPDCILSPSPFEWRNVELAAGTSLSLRYRLISHVGYVDQGWADARLSEFARSTP